MSRLLGLTPWWAKIGIKIALRRLPIPYTFWQRMGIFRHGQMDRIEYAYQVFLEHFQRVVLPKGFTCLELGPGDSLCTGLIAHAFGASKTWLVDIGPFAKEDPALYNQMASFLNTKGFSNIQLNTDLLTCLKHCNAIYLTEGLASLRKIPSKSIDFIFSQAVLEHIRLHDFDATIFELYRILKPGGQMSHAVDLQDHLSHALNNLRFRKAIWEVDWIAQSGFYTNRIQFSDMIRRVQSTGYVVDIIDRRFWTQLPTPRSALAAPFRSLPEEELRTKGFVFIAKS